jgi:hypothetical protein
MYPVPAALYCDCGADWQCASMPSSRRAKRLPSRASSASSSYSSPAGEQKGAGAGAGASSRKGGDALSGQVCYAHRDSAAVNSCAQCNKFICARCENKSGARIYCGDCAGTSKGGCCPCF